MLPYGKLIQQSYAFLVVVSIPMKVQYSVTVSKGRRLSDWRRITRGDAAAMPATLSEGGTERLFCGPL